MPGEPPPAAGKYLTLVGASRKQPEEHHCQDSPGVAHLRDRGFGLRKEHPGPRHSLPRPGPEDLPCQGTAREAHGKSRGSETSTRSSRSTSPPSAAPPAPTRRPIPASSPTSGSFSPSFPSPAPGVQGRPVQLQRQGRALRSLRRGRDHQDRDAFPAGRLCDLRRLPGQAIQPGNPGGPIQGEKHLRMCWI